MLKVTQIINVSPRTVTWICLTKACAFLPTYLKGRFCPRAREAGQGQ